MRVIFGYIDKTVRQYESVFSGTCIGFDLFFKASRLVISVQKCDLLTGLDALSNVLVLNICDKNLRKLTLKTSIAFSSSVTPCVFAQTQSR